MGVQNWVVVLIGVATITGAGARGFFYYDSRYDARLPGLVRPSGGFFYAFGQTDERVVGDMVVVESPETAGAESSVRNLGPAVTSYVRTSQPSALPLPPPKPAKPSEPSNNNAGQNKPPKNDAKGEAEDVLADNGILVGGVSNEQVPSNPISDLIPQNVFLIPLSEGQSLAQAVPSAVATAQGGVGGAQATPTATAVVGPGGVAIAFPLAEANVEKGVGIASPVATGTATDGGAAVAGGNAVATAGLGPIYLDLGNKKEDNKKNEGKEDRKSFSRSFYNSNKRGNTVVSPRIHNVFINVLRPQKQIKSQTYYQPLPSVTIDPMSIFSATPLWRGQRKPSTYSSGTVDNFEGRNDARIDLDRVFEAPKYSARSMQQLANSIHYNRN